MTGPPRKERMAIHMSACLSNRSQAGDQGDDRDTEQDAANRFGVADRRRYLIFQVWIAERIGARVETLHHSAGDGEAIAPCDRQRVPTERLQSCPHVTTPP